MQIKIDESAYSKKFHNILYSWDRYLIAYGGRGSGKTETLYIKYLLSLFEPYYFKLIYVNQEASSIRDQQYAGFKRVAKQIGVYEKLKFYDGDYRIVNQTNGNSLIPKGMDDPEKTKGLDNPTAIWWDEVNKGTFEGFRALNELLRTPAAKYHQFALSFNPVSETHWLRTVFFHPDNKHDVHPDYKGKLLLNRSTYLDNEFIDQHKYLTETLLPSAAGNQNTIRVNIEGDWGLEENNAPWLFSFDEAKHVVPEIKFYPGFPVYLSFDFNNDPLSCVAFQRSTDLSGVNAFIHVIKEFSATVSLKELCQQIKATFPYSLLFVTGDASGSNGDIAFERRNESYYTMIKNYLSLTDKMMNLNTKNLEHNDSRNLCNMMFANYPRIWISKQGCPKLINDCHIATVDEKKGQGKLLKDRDTYKMDLFDAMRYFFQTYYLSYVNKVWLKGGLLK